MKTSILLLTLASFTFLSEPSRSHSHDCFKSCWYCEFMPCSQTRIKWCCDNCGKDYCHRNQ